MSDLQDLANIANILRRDSLIMTTKAQSGHPTSCLSCAEIMSVLWFDQMSYSTDPNNSENDEFILSKGHAAPILYACLKHSGCIKDNLEDLRQISSNLEGHPTPRLNWIKFATGSLGQGLSIGLGTALAAKIRKSNARTYVLLGDSEFTEGSNYEALQLAPFYKLNNLCAILDINKLGQVNPTILSKNIYNFKKIVSSFGWEVLEVDGHKIEQITKAIRKFKYSSKPTMIFAKTIKGKGVSFLENKEGWHGKALYPEQLEKALKELKVRPLQVKINHPENDKTKVNVTKEYYRSYKKGQLISTREAYGENLLGLSKLNKDLLVLDAEVSNSTKTELVKKKNHDQFIECFIAEQNMISMALGLSKKGFQVFASTFAAFLTRAHDQIRMASLSSPNLTIAGSHAGVSIGKDGSSQMGLDDISMFRAFKDSIIVYPSDGVSTQKLISEINKQQALKYIRITRDQTPVIYNEKDIFPLGEFKVLKSSNKDDLVIAGAGITLHEALKAHEILKKDKISSAVIDIYSIKPFNHEKLQEFLKAHGKNLIIVEDHYSEGGIGEMIISKIVNIKIKHLAVSEIPHSGKKEEVMAKYRINAQAIVEEANKFGKN